MSVLEICIYISYVPIVIATMYAVRVYSQLPVELKVFSYFVFFSCAVQLTGLLLVIAGTHNSALGHFYDAAGFVFLAWFFRTVLQDFIKPWLIWGLSIALVIYTVINFLFIQPLNTFSSIPLTIESVLIAILSLSTFILLLNDIVKEKRGSLIKSLNWINSGLFIYYSSSLLIFHLTPVSSLYVIKILWILHSFFSILMYTCFVIAFYKRPQIIKP